MPASRPLQPDTRLEILGTPVGSLAPADWLLDALENASAHELQSDQGARGRADDYVEAVPLSEL